MSVRSGPPPGYVPRPPGPGELAFFEELRTPHHRLARDLRIAEHAAREALAAIHGPPPGGSDSRRAFHCLAATEKVRAKWEAERPHAARVLVEGGPVLWERGRA